MKQKAIISLFDYTGEMVAPWVKRGYTAFIFDIQHPTGYSDGPNGTVAVGMDLSDWRGLRYALMAISMRHDVEFLCGFPPCTDLAVSGAKHFKAKEAANPNYRAEAMELVYTVKRAADYLQVPGFLENPVSVIATEWRKPDVTFNPYEFGGYIPEAEATHPRWPDVIPPRDAYTKRTCLWTFGGFELPEKQPVPVADRVFHGWTKLGGKSLRTKNIRSATPRGFAEAVAAKYAHDEDAAPAWMGNNMRRLFGF